MPRGDRKSRPRGDVQQTFPRDIPEPAPGVRLHPLVESDIENALAFTLDRFGLAQYLRYEQLIHEALTRIIERPASGRPLKARAGFFLYSIARRGRRASHQILYRILPDGRVEILRFLHDSMDVPRHIPRGPGDG